VQQRSCSAAPEGGAGRPGRGGEALALDDAFASAGRLLELFGRTRSGPVFDRVCRMMRPWLLSYVRAFARDRRIDADETASAVLVNLFLSGGRFRFQGGEAFRRWMRVVARNAVRKEHRARAARARSLEGLPEPGDGGRDDPARRLAAREEAEIMAGAYGLLVVLCWSKLREIGENERVALALHHGRGMPIRETAARLGMRPELAAGLVRRARERMFRRILQALCTTRRGT